MAQDTVVFDTHEAVQQLTTAGLPKRQAEALVQLQARYFERNLVTKPDMELVVARLREEIGQAKDALSDKLDRNFKWLVGTQLGSTAVLIAAIKLV